MVSSSGDAIAARLRDCLERRLAMLRAGGAFAAAVPAEGALSDAQLDEILERQRAFRGARTLLDAEERALRNELRNAPAQPAAELAAIAEAEAACVTAASELAEAFSRLSRRFGVEAGEVREELERTRVGIRNVKAFRPEASDGPDRMDRTI